MGFGSYDESEQENQSLDADEEEDSQGVNVHQNDHEGEVSFESEATTDDLVDQLQTIKNDEDDE